MTHSIHPRLCQLGAILLLLAGGCSSLRPPTPLPAFYSFDNASGTAPATAQAMAPRPTTGPTLIVNPPHAAAGFDSQRIIFVRTAHQLEYYAHSEWVDTPARMLAPLIIAAVENGSTIRAVILTPSAAVGDLRLDTEIIRLQHEVGSLPGRVRFTLRAYVVDNATRRVLAGREFDESVVAESETPYGGVVAAHRAVQAVLVQLASLCNEAASTWRPPKADPR
ncbi:MAG: ABC-type transport auxiliary lipoprotein family protein [Sterolibacterium sp.]